ncbi:MAG: hypothetical protein AMXMBFR84_01540 [Candidatus Hydrogenedentota bacterium]
MGKKAFLGVAVLAGLAIAGCTKQETAPAGDTPAATTAAPAAAPTGGGATFDTSAKAIFEAKCAGCHIEQNKGGLSLASLESTLTGGKSGPVVVAGSADTSLLYAMVAGTAEKKMPPKGEGLTPEQLATLKSWIDGGAH